MTDLSLRFQTIFPGESALFDSIVDYEDLSEEALHCIIKSFPTNIGKSRHQFEITKNHPQGGVPEILID